MESLSDPPSELRVVAACYTRVHFPLIVSLQSGVQSRRSFTVYDIQSHHVTFFISVFRATSPVVVVRSHHHFLVSTFRAITGFQIDIQSRILGFGVQSRYHLDRKSVV